MIPQEQQTQVAGYCLCKAASYSMAMAVAWEHSIVHGITVFLSTVAAGSDTWAAWCSQLFIIDKEICF